MLGHHHNSHHPASASASPVGPPLPAPPLRGCSDGKSVFVNTASIIKEDSGSVSCHESDLYDICMNHYDKEDSDSESSWSGSSDTESFIDEYRPRTVHHHWQNR